jgi:hypothetical protein
LLASGERCQPDCALLISERFPSPQANFVPSLNLYEGMIKQYRAYVSACYLKIDKGQIINDPVCVGDSQAPGNSAMPIPDKMCLNGRADRSSSTPTRLPRILQIANSASA